MGIYTNVMKRVKRGSWIGQKKVMEELLWNWKILIKCFLTAVLLSVHTVSFTFLSVVVFCVVPLAQSRNM